MANAAHWSLLTGKETEKGSHALPRMWLTSYWWRGIRSFLMSTILSVEGAENLQQIKDHLWKALVVNWTQHWTGLFFFFFKQPSVTQYWKKYGIKLSSFQCGASLLNHTSVINYDTLQDTHIISKPKNLWKQLQPFGHMLVQRGQKKLFHKPTTWMSWQIYCLVVSSFHLV